MSIKATRREAQAKILERKTIESHRVGVFRYLERGKSKGQPKSFSVLVQDFVNPKVEVEKEDIHESVRHQAFSSRCVLLAIIDEVYDILSVAERAKGRFFLHRKDRKGGDKVDGEEFLEELFRCLWRFNKYRAEYEIEEDISRRIEDGDDKWLAIREIADGLSTQRKPVPTRKFREGRLETEEALAERLLTATVRHPTPRVKVAECRRTLIASGAIDNETSKAVLKVARARKKAYEARKKANEEAAEPEASAEVQTSDISGNGASTNFGDIDASAFKEKCDVHSGKKPDGLEA